MKTFLSEKKMEWLVIAAMVKFCFLLAIFRCWFTQSIVYVFLIWNLFLAGIPYVVTQFMQRWDRQSATKGWIWLCVPVWLVFFPNAPYIITDLFHLRSIQSMPVWFDLVLILSFAWTGLFLGFLSLRDMEKMLELRLGRVRTVILLIGLLFLCAFGIYLGRYLRWNSWDLVQQPMQLVDDIVSRFRYPFKHPKTWGMTILMGGFLNLVYWSIRFFLLHGNAMERQKSTNQRF